MCILRTCTTKTYVTIRLTMYTKLLHYYRFQSEHNWKGVCNHLERNKHLLHVDSCISITILLKQMSTFTIHMLFTECHICRAMTSWIKFSNTYQVNMESLKGMLKIGFGSINLGFKTPLIGLKIKVDVLN